MNEIIKRIVKLSRGIVSGSVMFGIEDADSDIDVFFEKESDFNFAIELIIREGGMIRSIISRAAIPAVEEEDYRGHRHIVRAGIPAEIDDTKKEAIISEKKIDLVLVDKILSAEEILRQKKENFIEKYGREICHLVQFHEVRIETISQKDLKYILLMKERGIYF